MELKLGNTTYELATSLRVVYALKDITHAKGLQEAISSISHLDLDGQLNFLWAAYKAANNESTVTKEEFTNDILDHCGIFAIADVINQLADGLLYTGLTPEQVASKKAEVEATIAQTAGTISSDTATE